MGKCYYLDSYFKGTKLIKDAIKGYKYINLLDI